MKKFITVILSLMLALTSIQGVFASDMYATRGETADMLLKAADFYNPAVQKTDIIKGYEDGSLHEEENVTRAEALVMLQRAFGNLSQPTGHNLRVAIPKESFTDIPTWAKNELENVFDSGIVAGTAPNTFSPDENVTKEQLELFIKRVYSLFASNEKDDFYATVNKDTLNKLEIKSGRIISGTLYDLQDRSTENVSKIIKDAIESKAENGTPEQKISDFYANIMDKESRNKFGIMPIKSYLDKIDSISSLEELGEVQKDLIKNLYINPLMGFGITIDLKDSTKYMLCFSSLSPTLTKEMYLNENETQKTAYLKYLKTLYILGGESEEKAQKDAADFYAFEKDLASKMMNIEDKNNVDKIYNIYSMSDIEKLFPNADIDSLLDATELKKDDKILVYDTNLLNEFASKYTVENLDALKDVMKINVLAGWGGVLNDDFVKASETFNQELLGVSGSYSDEERAALTLQSIMPDYIGKIYAEKYFDEQSKTDVENMINDIISVYEKRIQNLTWMSEATKEKAISKLKAIKIKVGYPDKWETYLDNANIKSKDNGGSYFDNMVEISKAQLSYMLSLQGTQVDKTKWAMYPYTVNACYSATANDITFPAAILQAPMYDKNASYEENLGAVGYIIAHEITHAFDNNGAKFDENGNAADWWTKEDYDKFQMLCEKVVYFYDRQEALPGIPMNGKITLSENVADIGAVACITEVANQKENADFKMLYKSMANAWATTKTREYALYAKDVDLHSDEKLRINRVLVNEEEFYKAFDISEGDGMFVPVNERIKIW